MKIVGKLFILLMFLFLVACTDKTKEVTIVTTNFPSYDFVRAITKNSDINVEMLIKPGSETHDFEPTPKDIIKIKKSALFVIIGGESDTWIKDILSDIKIDTKIIKLIDLVDLLDEELIDGMEGESEKETDEHVWTDPLNAIKIIEALKDEIVKIDSKNKELYEKNADDYIKELKKIDEDISLLVNNSHRREIIVADRFPFLYFAKRYNLTYYAAFKGCSDQSEASAKTLAFLINKVKEDKIPVVFHIELSNKKMATMVSEETNAKVLELNSAHNISLEDFNKNVTFVEIMKKNYENLKEALK